MSHSSSSPLTDASASVRAARTIDLAVEGMTCASCVARVEKKLSRLDGVSASVNLATESARVTAPAGISDDDLLAAVARAGYTARLKSGLAPAAPTATSSPSIREAAAHKLDKAAASPAAETTAADPAVPTASNSTASPLANSADSPRGPAGTEPARAPLALSTRSTQNAQNTTASPALEPAVPAAPRIGDSQLARAADLRLRLVYSLVLSVPVMAISMIPALQLPGWQWTVALMALPVATWGAWPFHRAAARGLRHGAFTMDTLVSLGVVAAVGWSLWALIWGGAGEIGARMTMEFLPRYQGYQGHQGHAAHMYFESAAWVTTFLLAGRYAEARARYRSGDALRALLELGAKEATRVRLTSPSGSTAAIDVLDDDGAPRADAARTEERVPVDALQPGDLLAVRPGEKIATDGVVVEGRSAVDASMLTGESVPVEVGISDAVTGGCVNTFGSLLVRATAVGAGTTLARIGAMVTAAQAGKAPVQRLADRVSGVFVPAVLVVSATTLAVWLGLGYPAQQALTAAVAVLVIACPCALGLATPTALLVGSGRAARLGVVIKGPEVLESSRALDTIVLDKTGTVTRGRMSLELADDDAITVAGGPDSPSNRENLGGPDGADSPGSGNDGNGPDGVDSPGCADSPGYAEGAESTHSTASTDRFEALRLAGALEAASEHPVAAAIAQAARAAATAGTTRADITDDAGNPDNADNAANADNPDNPNKPGNPDNTDIADIPDIPSIPDIAAGTTGTGSASASATVTATASAHLPHVEDFANHEGRGVTGRVEGREVAVGRPTWIAERGIAIPDSLNDAVATAQASGATAVVLAAAPHPGEREGVGANGESGALRALAVLVVRDTVRPSSRAAIADLRAQGVRPILLTGDNAHAAAHVAAEVGIAAEDVRADVLPGDKRAVVADLQERGHVVGMVGDGVNDAAALAQAGARGLGFAMGSGADAAIETADITLVRTDLDAVVTAIRISRATLRIIRQNLFWAFAYNVAAIPLAAAGLLNPMIAGAAMAASSVIVVTNSLRLRRAGA